MGFPKSYRVISVKFPRCDRVLVPLELYFWFVDYDEERNLNKSSDNYLHLVDGVFLKDTLAPRGQHSASILPYPIMKNVRWLAPWKDSHALTASQTF